MHTDQALIGEVLIRYASGIDRRDWALFRSCWTNDVEADYGELGTFSSAEALTDLMTRLHQDIGPTYHRMSNFVISIERDGAGDRATVRSYVHAVLMLTPDDPDNWVDAVGHYDDVFVRTPDGWRISRRISRTARLLTGSHASAGVPASPGETP